MNETRWRRLVCWLFLGTTLVLFIQSVLLWQLRARERDHVDECVWAHAVMCARLPTCRCELVQAEVKSCQQDIANLSVEVAKLSVKTCELKWFTNSLSTAATTLMNAVPYKTAPDTEMRELHPPGIGKWGEGSLTTDCTDRVYRPSVFLP